MMPGVEMSRGDAGCFQFIVRGGTESNGRRHHVRPERFRHERHDEPGIDAAGKKRAERNLALQTFRDSFPKESLEIVDGLRAVRRAIELRHVPILAALISAPRNPKPAAGFELPDVTVNGLRGQDITE